MSAALQGTLLRPVPVFALTLVLSPLVSHPAPGQCTPGWLPGWGVPGVTGMVNTLTRWDPDGAGPLPEWLVIGGSFQLAGDALASNIAAWDGQSWHAFGAGVNGDVRALAVYDGDLFAGGNFTHAGGSSVQFIARWDGANWHALGAGMNTAVNALTIFDGDLIAGGAFTSAGGSTANRVARWNGSAWSTLGVGAANGVGGQVNALATYGAELIVGGSFTTAGGASIARIARWNGASWQGLDSGIFGGAVNCLHVHGGELIVGGAFTTAGPISASRIARWNGASWMTLGSGMDNAALALASFGGELFAGGQFLLAGGTSASRIARWNGATWQPVAGGMDGNVSALHSFGGELIAGGAFQSAGALPASRLARWNGATWQPVFSGMNDPVQALAGYNGELVLAGSFTQAGGARANRIARWNGATMQPLGDGLDGNVLALTVFDGALFAGGLFSTAGSTSAARIARWNGSTWQPLGSGVDSTVRALTAFNGELIAAGNFINAGGITVNRVARWNGTSWQSLGSGTSSTVHALAVFSGELIAGGEFASAGGTTVTRIARWNGSAWNPLGSGMNGAVQAMTVYQGELIAGGQFTTAGGTSANRVARWNGSIWQPLGSGLNSNVNALAVHQGELIVGGTFATAGGLPAASIARWNGTSWQPMEGGLSGAVQALAVHEGALIVGGGFTAADGRASAYWARWGCPDDAWLCPGSIALIGWIDNGSPDTFAFVALRDLPAGTVIYFTDNGWSNATQSFRNTTGAGSGNEELCRWTATDVVPAGTIVRAYENADNFTWTISGSIPGATGNFSPLQLAVAGDQIYAFQADENNPLANPTVHLFVLDDTNGFEDATNAATGAVPPGLRPLLNALTFNESGSGRNFMAFNTATLSGVTAANAARVAQQIANGANWTFGGSGALPAGSLTPSAVGPTVAQLDLDGQGAVADGVLGADEYGPGNSYVYTGGGTGFGGTVGQGQLYLNSDTFNLYVGFQPGAGVNDNVVIYLDTNDCVSGHWDQTMTDISDGGRAAASDLTRDRLDHARLLPDFALVFSSGGAGAALFDLEGPAVQHQFISTAGASISGPASGSGFREAVIPLATLGLQPGAALDFFVAYCSDSRFNSNESIPPMPSLNDGPNPGFGTAIVEYTGFNRFVVQGGGGGCSPPSIKLEPEPVETCAGLHVSFQVTASGNGALSYQWRRDGQPLADHDRVSGAQSPDLSIEPVVGDDAGEYDCMVTNKCGKAISTAVALTVLPAPAPPLTASAKPGVICPALATDITLTAEGGTGEQLAWYRDGCDGEPVGTGSPLTIAAPDSAATYFARWESACGASDCVAVAVSLAPTAPLLVTVELAPLVTPDPLSRCIIFELSDSTGCSPPTILAEELTFVNGLAADVLLEVPCAAFDCISARDARHTLRRTAALAAAGGAYVAEFAGPGGWLPGGNLDDSPYIDIVDFAIYLSLYHRSYGSGDDACDAGGWHADINGDGVVNTLDFGFIYTHFLAGSEAACCEAADAHARKNARPSGPETRVSLAELERRGLGQLKPADLNADGVIDVLDVVEFLQGKRP